VGRLAIDCSFLILKMSRLVLNILYFRRGMKILITAGLVVVKDRRLLLAFSNNKRAYYLPGGKTDKGETTRETLVREVREELNVTLDPAALKFYMHVEAFAFGEQGDVLMKQDCFTTDLPAEPRPTAEIGDLQYFNAEDYSREPAQVPGVIIVMQQLRTDGLID